ncbi:matrix Gla protein-like [Rhea pennata]|uniref:matrix Gla protein-like n=1 Tax=Rhea pennata TaxID=8795 RepID=UPI002E26F764
MRSLLAPLILALALAVLCCCEKDSQDPLGSPNAASIKIKREVANAFMRRQKRSSIHEWYFEHYKAPMEQIYEYCENRPSCIFHFQQVGFPTAYNRYFGRY